MTRSNALIVILLIAASLGCSEMLPPVVTLVPITAPVDTATITPTETAAPTWTPTRDWFATPTQLTPTGAIVEVTPLGGTDQPATGTYVNNSNQRVRKCPSLECDIVRTVSAGQVWRFHDWRSWLPVEAWVCITIKCDEWMASTWESKEMGVITFDD